MSRTFLDTSVLVAAMIEAHDAHERCRPWLAAETGGDALHVAAHSIAELHSVLTRLPVSPRLSPRDAWHLIDRNVIDRARLIALTPSELARVVEDVARRGLVGGIVYDALIARAAEKGAADRLVTLNPRHFLRAWPPMAERVVAA